MFQDNDGGLFRVQFADPQPSGGLGVAGWKRMGRLDARTAGRVDVAGKAGRPSRLVRSNNDNFAAYRNAGNIAAAAKTSPQLASAIDRHHQGLGRVGDAKTQRAVVSSRNVGRSGEKSAMAAIGHYTQATRVIGRLGRQAHLFQRRPARHANFASQNRNIPTAEQRLQTPIDHHLRQRRAPQLRRKFGQTRFDGRVLVQTRIRRIG